MLSRNQWLGIILLVLFVLSQLPGEVIRPLSSPPSWLVATLHSPLTQWMVSASAAATRRPDLVRRQDPTEDTVRQLRAAREQVRRLQRRLEEYERIEARFGAQLEAFDYRHAQVTAWSGDPLNPKLRINRGWRHGVQEGDVVVDYRDLVGRVSDAGPLASTVRLITHPQAELNVRIEEPTVHDQPTRSETLVIESVPGRGQFEAMVAAEAEIEQHDVAYLHVGDLRVTGRPWPEHASGFDVGYVHAIEEDEERPLHRKRIIVRPVRDLTRLTSVTVIVRREYERSNGD